MLYRTGISSICPDGKSWETVELPEEVRVGQISVGPTGMVWVITWKGTLLLRTGVSKFRHMGEKNVMNCFSGYLFINEIA